MNPITGSIIGTPPSWCVALWLLIWEKAPFLGSSRKSSLQVNPSWQTDPWQQQSDCRCSAHVLKAAAGWGQGPPFWRGHWGVPGSHAGCFPVSQDPSPASPTRKQTLVSIPSLQAHFELIFHTWSAFASCCTPDFHLWLQTCFLTSGSMSPPTWTPPFQQSLQLFLLKMMYFISSHHSASAYLGFADALIERNSGLWNKRQPANLGYWPLKEWFVQCIYSTTFARLGYQKDSSDYSIIHLTNIY